MTRATAPLIGVTADVTETTSVRRKRPNETQLFLPERYLRAIESSGAIPVVLPATRSKVGVQGVLSVLSGLVVSGGNFDIHPRHYGERPIPELGAIKAARTDFELEISAEALRRDLPLLGICGGAQAINVVLGGTLHQDISKQVPGALTHERNGRRRSVNHSIRISARSRLFEIFGRRNLKVNTSHHQAVKKLGRGLVASAVADDGIIEGIESVKHRFVVGVQWHPEVLSPRQRLQRRLFFAFVEFCRQDARLR